MTGQRAIQRRHFLTALGLGGVALGLGSEPGAHAAPKAGVSAQGGKPLRFIGVYTPHGRAHELFQPGTDFDLSFSESVLAPFDDPARYGRSFRGQLLVLDGIDLSAGIAVGTTGHDGPRVILTGSGADGKNASLDQFLAVERGLGDETAHTSLALGVGNDDSGIGSNISWAKGGTPVPKWIDPSRVYAELFGEPLGAKREELELTRRHGKSVLDHVRRDLSRLNARIPASERIKLEQHATALRDIEKRLARLDDHSCPAPPAPDAKTFPKIRAYGGGEKYFDLITDLQIDLLVRALSCDLTRFATLFMNDLSHTGMFAELPEDIHGDVAHRYDARDDKHAGRPESWHQLGLQNRYTYGKVARLLQRLDEAGLLEHTIVYVSGDMGDPARHSSRSVPTLLAGGASTKLKFGRYLDLREGGGDHSGVPNNRILVSIAQLFGVETEQFGHSSDPEITRGRLDALHG